MRRLTWIDAAAGLAVLLCMADYALGNKGRGLEDMVIATIAAVLAELLAPVKKAGQA